MLMDLQLKQLRKSRGLTQEQLAESMGVDRVHVSRIESGARRANTDFLESAASILGASMSDMFKRPPIQIIGYIGAGGMVEAVELPLDTVERPPQLIGDIIAVKVKGSSMQPSLYDGDVVFYSENSTDIDKVIGKRPVIVNYGDGMIAVKQVMYGSKEGLYTLISINQSPITDIKVNWVAKIDWIKGG